MSLEGSLAAVVMAGVTEHLLLGPAELVLMLSFTCLLFRLVALCLGLKLPAVVASSIF